MKIIIDGNDGVGKTTLAKKLQNHFKIKSYIHLSGKDPRDFSFYFYLLFKEDVVFDRSFMDEIIYSDTLSRRSTLAEYEDKVLHDTVFKQKIIVVICHNKDKVYHDDEDPAIILNECIIDSYFYEIAKKYNYIYFNPKEETFESLLEKIATKLKDQEKSSDETVY